MTARLATFAVVGTVLHRAGGSARAVRYATAHRLRREEVLTLDVEVVVRARAQAEGLARARRGAACTLHDVAVEWARLVGLDEERVPMLVAAEVAVERDGLRAVPSAVDRVRQARAHGASVAFLEDTLMPADLLRDALRSAGALHACDRVWLSHELGASKADGGAYLQVARLLGGLPRQWTHVGHDPDADLRRARRAGVRAGLVTDAAPSRYEVLLDDACAPTGGLSGVLAGAARSTRLRLARERPLMPVERARVVAGVAGPLLAGYVLWCLRQAADAGVRRLYFVARDGEVMLAVARRLAPALDAAAGGEVELRYLHGSRRAWLRDAPDARLLRSVLGRQENLSVRDGLAWLDRTPEDAEDGLRAAGLLDVDAPLDEDGRDRLVEVLAAHPGPSDGSPDPLGAYLADVGLLDGQPYGTVDGAGHGSIGRLLTELAVRHGGRGPALECYYGLDGPAQPAPGRRPLGYAYDEWRGSGVRQSTDLWVALEMFTTASHGGVLGYEVVHDRPRPVLGPVGEAERWGSADVRAGLAVFAEELAATLSLVDPDVVLSPVTDRVATSFWTDPTRAEVRSWGDFPFEASTETYPVARPFSTADVARSLLRGRPRLRRRGSWPAGSVRSAPLHLRLLHLALSAARPRAAALRRTRTHWVDRRTLGRATGPARTGGTRAARTARTTEEER